MRQFDTINILDMLGAIGEAELQQCLSNLSVLNFGIASDVPSNRAAYTFLSARS